MMTQVGNDLHQKKISSYEQVTNALSKASDSLQTTTQQVKDTITETTGKAVKAVDIQSAIASSTSDWLQDHPAILRLLQILIRATDHPILSFIILVFVIAIAFSLIKVIGRFIDKIAISLLQAPLKLIQAAFLSLINTSRNLGGLILNKPAEPLSLPQEVTITIKDKHQQIAEISTRLEAIQQEQNELLKTLIELLATDKESLYNEHITS